MYICIHLCIFFFDSFEYIEIFKHLWIYMYKHIGFDSICLFVYILIQIYRNIYASMNMQIYAYIHIYTYIFIHIGFEKDNGDLFRKY
jgi:hypothetical protein